jgi:hypothetical protein
MQQRNVASELGLVVASMAVLVHWLDATPALLVTALIALAIALGTGPLTGEWWPWRMPVIPMVLPAVAAFSIAGIARLLAPAPWLVVVFGAGWVALVWVIDLETAPEALTAPEEPAPPEVSPEDEAEAAADAIATPVLATAAVGTAPLKVRMRPKKRAEFDLPEIVAEPVVIDTPQMPPHPRPLVVRSAALGLAFLGFVAVGGLVPGGFALDGQSLSTAYLAQFAVLSGLVAGVVGYRLAALTSPHRFDRIVRIVAFGQYAAPVAIAAAALRSLALPRLFIPALLSVLMYLLMEMRESNEPATQNEKLCEELVILGLAIVVVIAWGLLAK